MRVNTTDMIFDEDTLLKVGLVTQDSDDFFYLDKNDDLFEYLTDIPSWAFNHTDEIEVKGKFIEFAANEGLDLICKKWNEEMHDNITVQDIEQVTIY